MVNLTGKSNYLMFGCSRLLGLIERFPILAESSHIG